MDSDTGDFDWVALPTSGLSLMVVGVIVGMTGRSSILTGVGLRGGGDMPNSDGLALGDREEGKRSSRTCGLSLSLKIERVCGRSDTPKVGAIGRYVDQVEMLVGNILESPRGDAEGASDGMETGKFESFKCGAELAKLVGETSWPTSPRERTGDTDVLWGGGVGDVG